MNVYTVTCIGGNLPSGRVHGDVEADSPESAAAIAVEKGFTPAFPPQILGRSTTIKLLREQGVPVRPLFKED